MNTPVALESRQKPLSLSPAGSIARAPDARQTQSHGPNPNPAGDPLLACYQYLLTRALERRAAEVGDGGEAGR